MKRVLLGLLFVTIALIGICSVSAADADSVGIDNSYVGLDDSYVGPILQIGECPLDWTHNRNSRGYDPVGLDDSYVGPILQIGDDSDVLGWGPGRNPRG
ncbi:hypothetical protein [Methanobrevibacter sp.]|uniref:hypothetical protein n=1 Tax=Methanobrevibacter sp. TaxID=66852 RepID=UPI00388EF79A